MERPGEQVVRWLRSELDRKGLNVPALAAMMGRPRTSVRRLFSGSVAMTIDDLFEIVEALDLNLNDLVRLEAMPDVPEVEDIPEAAPAVVGLVVPDEEPSVLTAHAPTGNQSELLFRVAFEAEMDIVFSAKTEDLQDSGVPVTVLDQYKGRHLTIRLDAAYRHHQQPEFEEDGLRVRLSFDQIYSCFFPWTCIARFFFEPEAPDVPDPGDENEDTGPTLRLVT